MRVVEQVEGEGPPLGVPGGAADAVPARRGGQGAGLAVAAPQAQERG